MHSSYKSGALYLIPLPIASGAFDTLSPQVAQVTEHIRHYYVENIRTARRFLRALHAAIPIDEIAFVEMSKHHDTDVSQLRLWQQEGHTVGVMSEAGCPGIADPGAVVVAKAHQLGMAVVPLTGPSSILLALMASGLNGQSFAFNGYLPVKNPQRQEMIRLLESRSKKEQQTQLFIETPYRNNAMLQDLIRTCQAYTRICVCQSVGSDAPFIRTASVQEWKQHPVTLPKEPAVFLLLA